MMDLNGLGSLPENAVPGRSTTTAISDLGQIVCNRSNGRAYLSDAPREYPYPLILDRRTLQRSITSISTGTSRAVIFKPRSFDAEDFELLGESRFGLGRCRHAIYLLVSCYRSSSVYVALPSILVISKLEMSPAEGSKVMLKVITAGRFEASTSASGRSNLGR